MHVHDRSTATIFSSDLTVPLTPFYLILHFILPSIFYPTLHPILHLALHLILSSIFPSILSSVVSNPPSYPILHLILHCILSSILSYPPTLRLIQPASRTRKEEDSFFEEPPFQQDNISFTNMNLSRPLLKVSLLVVSFPNQLGMPPCNLIPRSEICQCAVKMEGVLETDWVSHLLFLSGSYSARLCDTNSYPGLLHSCCPHGKRHLCVCCYWHW